METGIIVIMAIVVFSTGFLMGIKYRELNPKK
jgi:hypothetical protein